MTKDLKDNLLSTILIGITLLCLAFLISGCGGGVTKIEGNNPSDPPPDPTLDCDVFEIEPNDDFFTPQFVDVLPSFPTNPLLCGYLSPAGTDIDTYYFPLAPNTGVTQVIFTLQITSDLNVVPVVELLQTIYDALGVPTGTHQSLGTFFGAAGILNVIDWPVPYDFMTHNDLYVRVTGLPVLTTTEDTLYKLDYFTQ